MGTEQSPETAGRARETTLNESWELIRQTPVGRLAVIHEGQPDIFPVNHVVEHGTVLFRTAGGTKHAAAVGMVVAFETDGYDRASGQAWSVVIRGVAREVSEIDDAIAVMGLPLLPWHEGTKPHFLRILPDTVTGRRFAVAPGSQVLRPDAVVPRARRPSAKSSPTTCSAAPARTAAIACSAVALGVDRAAG